MPKGCKLTGWYVCSECPPMWVGNFYGQTVQITDYDSYCCGICNFVYNTLLHNHRAGNNNIARSIKYSVLIVRVFEYYNS